ncbi:MAG: methyltransferase, TIGR04325 family [Bacteroidetes bacterium]|nr:MAG: methyltransferase, TIGR04325 family [Bacteroidota bacterium]
MRYRGLLRWLVIQWLKRKSAKSGYGYFGDYPSWEAATADSKGYDQDGITQKVVEASRAVRDGKANYERDGQTYRDDFQWDLLPWLNELAQKKSNLQVLDFGGALGSHYYPVKKLFPNLNLNWVIVEQESFSDLGKAEFETDKLHFASNLKEAWVYGPYDVIILGCVLPYLDKPYEVLKELKAFNPEAILIDKHPVIKGDKDRLTVQHISPDIYEASYPAWFFSERKFKTFMSDYKLEKSILCPDIFNVNSEFKSYFYRRKQ